MKRYLPFLMIVAVALVTAGAGMWLYRAKMNAQAQAAGGSPLDAGKPADSGELHAVGPADAPATLEIYGDFQCPPCATASMVISKLQESYRKRLRVIFLEFPLAMHAYAVPAAAAAEAAGLQGHFWEMHDLLYQGQGAWSKAPDPNHIFTTYATSLGLEVERFNRDAKSVKVRGRVLAEREAGATRGVRSTPTIFVNGTQLQPPFTEKGLQDAIEKAIGAPKKS